jgi:hypothetical protein
MRRMDWDTQKPGDVSRSFQPPRQIDTYVHKHNDDGIDHNDCCGTPEEHSILSSDVSYLSGV